MRLIDADKLLEDFQRSHDFFINAYGGFENLPPKEKARVDEITTDMARVINAPTVDAVSTDSVLEIIDDVFMEVANGLIHTSSEALEETRNRVKGLKGEQG